MVDCAQPAALARFWAFVLKWPEPTWTAEDLSDLAKQGITSPEDDPVVFIAPHGETLPRLCFQRVPEGKSVKNRLHLDVNVDEPEVSEFVQRGARVIERQPHWVVLGDPEGNEFCAVLD